VYYYKRAGHEQKEKTISCQAVRRLKMEVAKLVYLRQGREKGGIPYCIFSASRAKRGGTGGPGAREKRVTSGGGRS